MWNTILEKVKAGMLVYWSQVVWFVLGALLGVVLLGGLVSCTTVGNAYEGVKSVGAASLGTVEGIAEGVVEDASKAADLVTGKED